MMPQKLVSGPKTMMARSEAMAKLYFTSLPFHPQCLNLRANIGSSQIKSQLDSTVVINPDGTSYRLRQDKGDK